MNFVIRDTAFTFLYDFCFQPSVKTQLCEACTEGEQTHTSFKVKPGTTSKDPLKLVHSDVYGEEGVGLCMVSLLLLTKQDMPGNL